MNTYIRKRTIVNSFLKGSLIFAQREVKKTKKVLIVIGLAPMSLYDDWWMGVHFQVLKQGTSCQLGVGSKYSKMFPEACCLLDTSSLKAGFLSLLP